MIQVILTAIYLFGCAIAGLLLGRRYIINRRKGKYDV